MIRIIFIPTWKCNFHCPYCDYKTKKLDKGYELDAFQGMHKEIVKKEPNAFEWLDVFSRFEPYHLELTGGEPTYYYDINRLLSHIPIGSFWSVTTNLSNIEPFLKANPKQCVGMTASYHPYAKEPYSNLGWFRDQLMQLRTKGYNPIQVTIVGYPYNIEKWQEYINFFERDFNVNLMLYFKRGWDWTKHPKLLEKALKFKKYFHGNKKLSFTPSYFKKCSAGFTSILVNPNGNVYRCYSAFIQGKYYMGNIFDENFHIYNGEKPCKIGCYFPCDLELAGGE